MKTILMADDEEDLRTLLKMTLEDPEFRLIEACDGVAAWAIIQKEHPDLVILDWMMPGKSGKEVAQEMKNKVATKNIPIIMLTAKDRQVDRQEGGQIGVTAYLVKPFSPLELLDKVQQALGGASPTQR